jgi:hypothetical protein
MMEHRIFIKRDNIKYYKTDSFWSLSENPAYAKMHHCPGYIPENLLKNLESMLNTGYYDKNVRNENTKLNSFYINSLIGYENPETNESVIMNQIVADGNKYKIIVTREKKLERILNIEK